MKPAWLAQPERGSALLLRLMVWIALRLGRRVGRVLLYPICAYFLLFSPATRRASREFLGRVLGRSVRWRDLFRHYHTFAAVILDRVYLLAGREERFQIELHGVEVLERMLAQGRGCLLVGSHLGSFEILRVLGMRRRGLRIKTLAFNGNSHKMNAVLRAINPEVADTVIPVGDSTALLDLERHLAEGALVCLLGDRVLHGEKRVACQFLGEEAWFPAAPAMLSGILKAPAVLFYGIYRGDYRYEIHFELLNEAVSVSRRERESAIREIMQRYAGRLEQHCRQAPYNWFNFYDFWESDRVTCQETAPDFVAEPGPALDDSRRAC